MLYDNMFAQVNVLNKAVEASSLKNEAITNNIANADTPGYKKQTVNFEEYLAKELNSSGSIARKVDLDSLNATIVLENPQYDMRIDESNIDIDVEMTERAKNYVRYSGLADSVTSSFKKIEIILNNMK